MAPHYLDFINSTKGNKEMKKVERAIRLYSKVNVNETKLWKDYQNWKHL